MFAELKHGSGLGGLLDYVPGIFRQYLYYNSTVDERIMPSSYYLSKRILSDSTRRVDRTINDMPTYSTFDTQRASQAADEAVFGLSKGRCIGRCRGCVSEVAVSSCQHLAYFRLLASMTATVIQFKM